VKIFYNPDKLHFAKTCSMCYSYVMHQTMWDLWRVEKNRVQPVPFIDALVQAGFPSPAEELGYQSLDLNQRLIPHPHSTYIIRIIGESMKNCGIMPGDLAIVDRSRTPKHCDTVIAVLNGEMTIKRLEKRHGKIALVPENDDYETIQIQEGDDFEIWGVVTSVIHEFAS